jgi:SHS2 domain-containing protein
MEALMYETFEHTADLGLRVRAADLDTLFAEAACGLFSMLVDNLGDVRGEQEIDFQLDGSEKEYLLFDWLNELLYSFETEHWLFSEFDVHVADDGMTARARGEKLDPARHRMSHEVKAITYHLLAVAPTPDGWQAEVIVDI